MVKRKFNNCLVAGLGVRVLGLGLRLRLSKIKIFIKILFNVRPEKDFTF
ncbi:hypothetical protein SAMN05421796_101830 [Chryseobacterium piscicola]|uniref:Uncharacterized protein n=1 Tax=Chryseobacterium piscicola TaxID=551459 RepID=A0A1N7KUL1_9FLAO|nr:hypothetical protein SAMN05421796_101830 [Chryseobacterium piscicola]